MKLDIPGTCDFFITTPHFSAQNRVGQDTRRSLAVHQNPIGGEMRGSTPSVEGTFSYSLQHLNPTEAAPDLEDGVLICWVTLNRNCNSPAKR